MRGKDDSPYDLDNNKRITPAYAGKSFTFIVLILNK